MCHGGLIVFRCYLRNKTHLVKALQRNPVPTTSPETLTAAASTPGQTQQYGSTKYDLIRTRCHSLTATLAVILAKKLFRGIGIQGHAQCPTSAKIASCLFSHCAFQNQSLSHLRPIILSLLPCGWPPGWSVLRGRNDGLCVWLLKAGRGVMVRWR